MKERKILRGEDYKFTPSVEKKAEREKKKLESSEGRAKRNPLLIFLKFFSFFFSFFFPFAFSTFSSLGWGANETARANPWLVKS